MSPNLLRQQRGEAATTMWMRRYRQDFVSSNVTLTDLDVSMCHIRLQRLVERKSTEHPVCLTDSKGPAPSQWQQGRLLSQRCFLSMINHWAAGTSSREQRWAMWAEGHAPLSACWCRSLWCCVFTISLIQAVSDVAKRLQRQVIFEVHCSQLRFYTHKFFGSSLQR